jgi:hypothetical protein
MTSILAVFGSTLMGLAQCGGATAVDAGGHDTAGDQSASGGNGGSGGSATTGGGATETGGSSSGSAGAGDMSGGAGGVSGLDAGTGDSNGIGDASSADTGDICQNLVATFKAALLEAKRCNPAVSAQQCQFTVPDSLDCPGLCSTRVQDPTMPAEIRNQWTAGGCPGGLCPGPPCLGPHAPRCVPTDAGGGICID